MAGERICRKQMMYVPCGAALRIGSVMAFG
jgi:hypothetical protein